MSDFTYERLKENLERLKMKNPLEILDNYLEQEPPSGGKTDTNVRIPN